MVRTTRYLGSLAGLVLIGACTGIVIPAPEPTPTPEPTPAPVNQPTLCERACDRWQELGCEEGGKVCDKFKEPEMTCSAFITCDQWCQRSEDTTPQAMNLECIVSAEADSCVGLEDACAF